MADTSVEILNMPL